MNIEIVTPGACGTYYIASLLGIQYNKLNLNTHRRNPSMPKNFKGKIIYLYSNPYDAIISFHRRGFLKKPYSHCTHIGGDLKILNQKKEWTLKEYLSLGIDCFKLQEHFRSWFDFDKRTYDIMFIKYESLPTTIDKLLEWYQLPNLKNNFKFIKRRSNWKEQPKEIIDKLDLVYGEYKNYLNGLAEVICLEKV